MDFWDWLDDWKAIVNIIVLLIIAAIWLGTRSSRNTLAKMLYRFCAVVLSVVLIVGLYFFWRLSPRVRNPAAVHDVKRIALVTFATDTELITGDGEEATARENPKAARALANVQMEQTISAFNQSAFSILPLENVIGADPYRKLSYPKQSKRKSGLFASQTIVSADDNLCILPVNDSKLLRGLSDSLEVDALLIIQCRYQLDSDWRDSVPLITIFTDPYWHGSVRIRAWLVGRDGAVIWRYRENVESKKKERAHAYNYIIVSGSEITAQQSLNLLLDAISAATEHLQMTMEKDCGKVTN